MMTETNTDHHCHQHHNKVVSNKGKERTGFLTGIFLILLPKCPFCLMAYSSTLMLCEKGSEMNSGSSASATTIILTLFFCLIALLSILFNYRGKRTIYAIGLAISGCVLILISVAVGGGLPLYYSGIVLLFTGVWLNASLLSLVQKIRNRFSRISTN